MAKRKPKKQIPQIKISNADLSVLQEAINRYLDKLSKDAFEEAKKRMKSTGWSSEGIKETLERSMSYQLVADDFYIFDLDENEIRFIDPADDESKS